MVARAAAAAPELFRRRQRQRYTPGHVLLPKLLMTSCQILIHGDHKRYFTLTPAKPLLIFIIILITRYIVREIESYIEGVLSSKIIIC